MRRSSSVYAAWFRPARRWLEVALWAIGIASVAAYVTNALQTASAQSAAMQELETNWLDQANVSPDQSMWSEKRIAEFAALRTESGMPAPLGILTIPDVAVRVAVFNGTTEEVLNIGAGRVPGTAAIDGDGNLAIAAHRDGFFRGLKDIAIGNEITLQRGAGSVTYSVADIRIVDPSDVSVLAPTQTPTITLITCYPFYYVGDAPKRFIVRAKLQTRRAEL